jgi:hypothetical protein
MFAVIFELAPRLECRDTYLGHATTLRSWRDLSAPAA